MIAQDRLKSDEEKLDEAARYTSAIARADRLALYASVVAGAATAYFVYVTLWRTYDWVGEYAIPMLTFVFGAALIARHLVTVILYRAYDIGEVPLLPWSRVAAVAKPQTARNLPTEVAVPRLDPSAKAQGIRVITSPLLEGPSVFVAPGGRATTRVDQLPVGVAAMTEAGFVFYPNADAHSAEALKELKNVAWELAKDTFKPLGVLAALGVGEVESSDPSLPEWVERSRAHPEFFSFGWSELVSARMLDHGIVRVVHEAADAPRAEHVVRTNDAYWPLLFMKMRLQQEMAAVLIKKVKEPKADELAPALLEQFRGVYGDRVGEHTAELYAELNKRVNKAVSDMSGQLDDIAREGLAPVLPHFAKYPEIVESYSILFPEKAAAASTKP